MEKHENRPRIEALVLAAGEARRFGRPKQLLPWGAGRTILSHLLGVLGSVPEIDRVNLVLGAWIDEITETLGQRLSESEIIPNPDWRKGMFSSLTTGLSRIRENRRPPDGILVLLGDMPFVDRKDLTRICRAGQPGETRPVIAVENGRPAHPYLIRTHHIGEILSMSGESGIRPFIRKEFPRAIRIEVEKSAGRQDIDTWESYFSHRPADSGPVIPPPPPAADGL